MIIDDSIRLEAKLLMIQLNELVIPENKEMDVDKLGQLLIQIRDLHTHLYKFWRTRVKD